MILILIIPPPPILQEEAAREELFDKGAFQAEACQLIASQWSTGKEPYVRHTCFRTCDTKA